MRFYVPQLDRLIEKIITGGSEGCSIGRKCHGRDSILMPFECSDKCVRFYVPQQHRAI